MNEIHPITPIYLQNKEKNVFDETLDFGVELKDEPVSAKIRIKLVVKLLEDRKDTDLNKILKFLFKLVETNTEMDIWILCNQSNGLAEKLNQKFNNIKFFYVISLEDNEINNELVKQNIKKSTPCKQKDKLIFIKKEDEELLFYNPYDIILKYCLLTDSMSEEYFTIRAPSNKDQDAENFNIFKTLIYVSLFVNEITHEKDIIKYFKGIFREPHQSSIYKFLFLTDRSVIERYRDQLRKANLRDLGLINKDEFPREPIREFQSFVCLSIQDLKDEKEYKKEFIKANEILNLIDLPLEKLKQEVKLQSLVKFSENTNEPNKQDFIIEMIYLSLNLRINMHFFEKKSSNVNFLTTIKGNNSALYSSKEVRQKILNNVDSFLEEPFTN